MRKYLFTLLLLSLMGGKLLAQEPASFVNFHSHSSMPVGLTVCIPRSGLEGFGMDSITIAMPPNGVQLIPVERQKGAFIFVHVAGERHVLWISREIEQRFFIQQAPGSPQAEITGSGQIQAEMMVIRDIERKGQELFPLFSNTGFPQGLSFKQYSHKADSVHKLRKQILETSRYSFTAESYRDLEQWLDYRNMEIKLRWRTLPGASGKVKCRSLRFARKNLKARSDNDSFFYFTPAVQAMGLYHTLYRKPVPAANINTVEDMKKWDKLGKKLDGRSLELAHAWYLIYLAERRSPEQNRAMLALYAKTHTRSPYFPYVQRMLR